MKVNKKLLSMILLTVMLFSSAVAFADNGDVYKKEDFSLYAKARDAAFNVDGKGREITFNSSKYYYELNGKFYEVADLLKAYNEDKSEDKVNFEKDLEENYVGIEKPVDEEELKVVEVSAINAKQIQIKFSKAVDESTVITGGALTANVKINGIGTSGTDFVNPGTMTAELSEDGKTLTITAQAAVANYFEGKYAVLVTVGVTDEDGNAIEPYAGTINVKDTTRPTVTGITYPDNGKAKISFSEPLRDEGTITPSDDNIAIEPFAVNDDFIIVDLTDTNLELNKNYTITILGAQDGAGNLITPNPTNVVVKKVIVDDVKPEVVSLEAVKEGVMKITFSEKLKADNTGKIATFEIGTTPAVTSVDIIIPGGTGTPNATVDKTGTVVTVTDDTNLTAGTKTIKIDNYEDLSGNPGDPFTKVVEFKADTTAPKLVSSVVKKDNAGKEFLHLTFDEPVDVRTVSNLPATQVYNYITTEGTINLNDTQLAPVPNTDDMEYEVELSAVKFTPDGGTAADLKNGAKYTVTLTGAFKDKKGNALEETEITFTRGADTLTAKPKVTSITQSTSNNDLIKIDFDMPLDGASATNKANYSIEGLEIESVRLLSPGDVVEIKLVSGTNTLTGYRNVSISGVKNSDGVAMDPYTEAVNLVENVRPKLVSAKFTSETEITATFSEEIAGTGVFEVYVDGVKLDSSDFTVGTVSGKDVVITLTNPVTLSKTYEVKYVSGIEDKATPSNPAVPGIKVTVTN